MFVLISMHELTGSIQTLRGSASSIKEEKSIGGGRRKPEWHTVGSFHVYTCLEWLQISPSIQKDSQGEGWRLGLHFYKYGSNINWTMQRRKNSRICSISEVL